jgi:uncharacterized YigZ family protein
MAILSYLTLKAPSEGTYKDKGSRFLSFAYPVTTEADIKAHLEALRRRYFDARHHCYAWMLGPDKKNFRASDDGEPNHSAGDPILGQIRAKELTNVLVVVVRYFGGIKLGVGGLVSAYRAAAAEALRNSIVIEEEVTVRLMLKYPYEKMPEVMRMAKDFGFEILLQDFGEHCMMRAAIPVKHRDGLLARVDILNAHGIAIILREVDA